MNRTSLPFIFWLFFCLIPLISVAQNEQNCLQFEDLEIGDVFGESANNEPGEVIYSALGVDLRLREFYVSNTPSPPIFFGNATVLGDSEFPGDHGNSWFIHDLNFEFDFSNVPDPVTSVCFNYYELGGQLNISVNGQDIIIVGSIAEIPVEIAPGVTFHYTTSGSFDTYGVACLNGPIETLLIGGGVEFGLDNICYSTTNEDCSILNVEYEIQPCTPNGIFYVNLFVDVENPGNDGFQVVGNGVTYGNFSYDVAFAHVGPFTPNANGIYELLVIDNQFPDCRDFITFGPINCNDICNLEGVTAYPVSCIDDDGHFNLFVDIDYSSLGGSNTGLYLNGELYETYSPNAFPLLLENVTATSTQLEVKVCTDNVMNCCKTALVTVLDTLTLDCAANCIDFENLTVGDVYGIENGNGYGDTIFVEHDVAITLDSFVYFDGSGAFLNAFVTEGFFGTPVNNWGTSIAPSNINLVFDFASVYGTVTNVCFEFSDGGGEENFSVNGSPLQVLNNFNEIDLSTLPDNIQVDVLIDQSNTFPTGTVCITGEINQLTIGGQELVIDNVCFNTGLPDCEVTNFVVEPYDCDNDSFLVDVIFEISAPGNQGYSVAVNGGIYGPFDYDGNAVTLGPFPGNATTQYYFSAYDNQNYSCGADFLLGGIDCENPSCRIENLDALFVGCDANNTQTIQVNFDFFNVNQSGFDVYVNNEFFEYYPHSDLPIYLQGIEQIPGTAGVNIRVCNNDNPDCCADTFVEWVQCDPEGCIGFEYFLEAIVGSTTGHEPGDVVYTENAYPLSLETFANANGSASFGDLLISNAALYPDFVNGAGRFIYFLDISGVFDFDQQAAPVEQVSMDYYYPSGGQVNIKANGGNFHILDNLSAATYTLFYPTGVVQLEIVPVNDVSGQFIFTGHIESLLIGAQGLGIDNVCTTVSEDCFITDLMVETGECIDGVFSVNIDFNHANTSGSFTVILENEILGNFSYDDLPLHLEGFSADPNQAFVFQVFDSQIDGCGAIYTVLPPNCDPDCFIGELQVDFDCNLDNDTYGFTLNFDYQNVSDQFILTGPNNYSETFSYSDLPISVSGFECGPLTVLNQIKVTDLNFNTPGALTCTSSLAYNCPCNFGGDCSINDLSATYTCDGDELYVTIVFIPNNPGSNGYTVFAGGEVFGPFDYQAGPNTLTVGPVASSSIANLIVSVKDASFNNCLASVDLGIVSCTMGNCEIGNGQINYLECLPNGEYEIDFDFDAVNAGDSFTITNNAGQTYTINANGPYTLSFFLDQNVGYDELTICSIDHPNCCYTLSFDLPCTSICNYGPLHVTQECNSDGSYYLVVDFDYSGPVSDLFELTLDGGSQGTFQYSQLPVTIGPITQYPIDWHHILVTDVNGNCAEDVNFIPELCGSLCAIYDFTITESECIGNGTYTLTFDFGYEHPDNDFFDLYNATTNELIGTFPLNDLPLTLTFDVTSSTTPVATFNVCINDSPNCCATATVQLPNCNGCEIEPGIFEPYCDNGFLFLEFSVQSTNGGADGFMVIIEGETFGPFPYINQVQFAGPVEIPNDGIFQFHFYDVQHPDCVFGGSQDLPPSCFLPCGIHDLTIEPIECNPDGSMQVQIDFSSSSTINNFFDLYDGNGELVGFYPISDLPITVTYSQNTNTLPAYTVCINDNPNCCLTSDFAPLNCQPCPITNVIAEPFCEGGELYVEFYVDHTNNFGSNGFEIMIHGVTYGPFIYDGPNPIIGPLQPTNSGIIEYWVQDISFPDCVYTGHFEFPNCTDDCNFSDIIVEAHDCNDGVFYVDIAFTATDPGPLGYYVFADGQINGPFSYNEPFITLGPFHGDGETVYDFLLLDIADPSCFGYAELGPINCDPDQCQIYDIIAEAHECADDGTFLVDIAFEHQNVGDAGYTIIGNGNNYGTFSYDEPFITLGPFDGDNETIYEFIIIDNAHPNCSGYVEIGPIYCPGPCLLPDTEITTTVSCYPGEDVYELTIDFDYANADNIGFDITFANGDTEFFSYSELPLSLTLPIPANGEEAFTICENDRPDCCKDVVATVPCCGIFGLIAEAHDCADDGTFKVDIDFDHLGTDGSFTLVYGALGGTLNTAIYSYDDLPITVGPLNGTSSADWFFQVTDISLFCQASVTLEDIYCGTDECVEFEDFNESFFGPATGYFDGDEIGEEDGVSITYETLDNTNCNSCFIFILSGTTYPQFTAASGDIATVSQSGIGFDFTGLTDEVVEVSVDYYHANGDFSLVVNGGDFITVDNPVELPMDIAPGVMLSVVTSPNDPNQGTMTFTGTIESLEFYSFLLLLDNLCMETVPDTDICMVLGEFDMLNAPFELGTEDDAGELIYEENGVEVTAEYLTWANDDPILFGIKVVEGNFCTEFALAEGPYFHFDGSAMRLSFAAFEELPTTVSFDYSYCPGTDFINLQINDNEIFRGFFEDAPTTLGDGSEIIISQLPTTPGSGTITVTGTIESLLIGGVPLSIDNICYNGTPPQEDVWPGDANSDNIANHIDLINIGLAYGNEGPERQDDGNAWDNFTATNWANNFADGTNHKHADCNGDGQINVEDRNAILLNYNLTHGPQQAFPGLPGTDLDPPIFVDFPDNLPANTSFEVPIILGTEDHPMEDIYGIAFTVHFDPDLFDPATLVVEYPASWFGEEDINMITLDKVFDDGIIEIALVRTDHNEVSGFGQIAVIRGIIDDIAGVAESEILIGDITAIDTDEIRIPIQNPVEHIEVGTAPIIIDHNPKAMLYPNPASGWVNVSMEDGAQVQAIEIFDTHHNRVLPIVSNESRFNVATLPAGVYMVKLKIDGIIHRTKLVKVD